MQAGNAGESALFLHGDTQALSMALWNRDHVVFMRRIPWPEPLFSPADLVHGESRPIVTGDTAGKIMASVCEQVRVSLYYVTRGWQDMHQPDTAVLSGCLADTGLLPELLADELGVTVSAWQPGHDTPGLALDTSVQQQWTPAIIGSAIELALAARQRRKRHGLLNFLRGEFAPGAEQYFSRRTLQAVGAGLGLLAAGLIVFLWFGYQRLDSRASALLAQMNTIYHQTFPGGPEKVDRPYLYMQSKMREMEGTEVALPLFSDKKRILDILADISARIPDDLSLHVSRLVVDPQGVQLKGTTDAFNNVDVIKNRLAASGRYAEVKIVSATADKKKGTVRFEIHLQLGEAS
jgi:general secretion pathway protein L